MLCQDTICVETKDVISGLPKFVIQKILGCMPPLQDVGRTSTLSRKWRYYRETLPQLVFGRDFFEGAAENILRDLHAVIILHSGLITNFVLQIPENSPPKFHDHVDQLVLFLSRSGIKNLTLEILNPVAIHKLPSNLFSCLKLSHLKLRNYTFQPLPGFKGFQFLSNLDFYEITIRCDVLEMLISSSLLLKKFTLDLCRVVNHFIIHAPNLSFLRIHGAYKFSLRNTWNLAVAFFNLAKMDGQLEYKCCNLNSIVPCLVRTERLVISSETLEILGAVPAKLTMKIFHLKYLELHDTSLYIRNAFWCAIRLIRGSPNFQELKILVSPLDLEGGAALNFSKGATLHKLQFVKIQHIKGFLRELELIRFLLACSPMLRSMVIEQGSPIHATNDMKLLRGLQMYPRASPKVKILYLEPSDGKTLRRAHTVI